MLGNPPIREKKNASIFSEALQIFASEEVSKNSNVCEFEVTSRILKKLQSKTLKTTLENKY